MAFDYNPIDTAAQRDFERTALAVFALPEVAAERAEARQYWLAELKPGPALQRRFDAAFEEVMFGATVWAVNQDPMHPGVCTISRLAHRVDGLAIPGSRWGIDNPDSVYRVIPISGDQRYRIRGKVAVGHRLSENYFTLWDGNRDTVAMLDGKDLAVATDGSFEISVDADEAGGRRNHVRSSPAAHQFYIRDVLQNWGTEMINELSVERLGGGDAAPRSLAEHARQAIEYQWSFMQDTIRWNAQALNKAANSFDFTIDRDTDGALRNQVYLLGHFQLEAGQALLIDINMGGANYFIAPITNRLGTTNEISDRCGSLNKSQSLPNADGSYSFVVSVEDPGQHNWVDPSGMDEGILTLRWAAFADGQPSPALSARCQLIAVSNLAGQLPPGTPMVTPAERADQQQLRASQYAWRLLP